MSRKLFFKPILLFLPLLVIYTIIVLVFASDEIIGDEARYLQYAKNLVQGFYTDSANPDLSNGPGYPIILIPFVAFNIPFILAKILNGVFVFIAVNYLYGALKIYISDKSALLLSYAMGFYPPLLKWMILLYTESLSFMLICGIIYHLCIILNKGHKPNKHYLMASFYLGFLVVTKAVFFHVIIIATLLLLVNYLIQINRKTKAAIIVSFGAMILIAPYILYTYNITGKAFYLGTRGGEILYHRSTPFEKEQGDWFSPDLILGTPHAIENSTYSKEDLSKLADNHRAFYLKLQAYDNIKKDSIFKAKAIMNMKEYPFKYIRNTISNTGRLLFNYPLSYRYHNLTSYGYIIPNMFIVVFFIVLLYPAYLIRKVIPYELKAILCFVLIYCFGMILLGGKARYFILAVPGILLFLSFVYSRTIKVVPLNRSD
ncbi:hypothetical protein [Muriicola sp. Z0-33]|uniref:hypothetical protein n=1 Tax=Muriicola sp. Z0-33 TaxID=2816957 RepID=UPI00223796FB|nr:hypothetical protein [Muriicola sp. Z0-33]MCW5515660.1 hypothetical protein [Muriicola sp. Z0-33]